MPVGPWADSTASYVANYCMPHHSCSSHAYDCLYQDHHALARQCQGSSLPWLAHREASWVLWTRCSQLQQALHVRMHAGVTLEDLRIRQDVLSGLPVPIELREGSIARLHISGDWTFAKGLRPRVELSGVAVALRFGHAPRALQARAAAAAEPVQLPAVPGAGAEGGSAEGSAQSTAPTPSLTAAAVKQLLKRVCVDVRDVRVTLVDTCDTPRGTAVDTEGATGSTEPVAPAPLPAQSPRVALQHVPRVVRCTSAGVAFGHITTEGRNQPDARKASDGSAFVRAVDVDFQGMFWVPEAISVAQAVPPAALLSPAEAQPWLIVQPCSAKV